MLKLTEAQYEQLVNDQMGVCLACRTTKSGCEPDARQYECDECGKHEVYGTEECLLMGRIELVGDDTESNIIF
jgi:hypothetical protein